LKFLPFIGANESSPDLEGRAVSDNGLNMAIERGFGSEFMVPTGNVTVTEADTYLIFQGFARVFRARPGGFAIPNRLW
jgi:hypothetical protein